MKPIVICLLSLVTAIGSSSAANSPVKGRTLADVDMENIPKGAESTNFDTGRR